MDLEFTILLPGGGVFHFSGPFPVSDRQWDHIRHVMDAMAPGLVTSDDPEADAHAFPQVDTGSNRQTAAALHHP
jgi:hypothetical protein